MVCSLSPQVPRRGKSIYLCPILILYQSCSCQMSAGSFLSRKPEELLRRTSLTLTFCRLYFATIVTKSHNVPAGATADAAVADGSAHHILFSHSLLPYLCSWVVVTLVHSSNVFRKVSIQSSHGCHVATRPPSRSLPTLVFVEVVRLLRCPSDLFARIANRHYLPPSLARLNERRMNVLWVSIDLSREVLRCGSWRRASKACLDGILKVWLGIFLCSEQVGCRYAIWLSIFYVAPLDSSDDCT